MIDRSLYLHIWHELAAEKTMIFCAGPRQVGKTTLAKTIADSFPNNLYFNWDIFDHRKTFTENPLFFESVNRHDSTRPLIILDEIHKYRRWKNYLKGIYDQFGADYLFLILGSGRLDTFRKGGDSLAGRYFLFNIWPLTVAELSSSRRVPKEFFKNPLDISTHRDRQNHEHFSSLSRISGFPEPFTSGKETFYRRWFKTYRQQLIREDIRNLTGIKNIDSAELLFSLIPSKVGSPLSVANCANDLHVSHTAVKNWLTIFESFFLVFKISPYSTKIARAITKEKKYYLFCFPEITDPAARLENMVALELFRAVNNWNDLGYGEFSLHYIRNKEKQEVDFLITRKRTPFLLVETKLNEEQPSPPLRKFQEALRVPAIQLIEKENICKLFKNNSLKILVSSACDWIASLP